MWLVGLASDVAGSGGTHEALAEDPLDTPFVPAVSEGRGEEEEEATTVELLCLEGQEDCVYTGHNRDWEPGERSGQLTGSGAGQLNGEKTVPCVGDTPPAARPCSPSDLTALGGSP